MSHDEIRERVGAYYSGKLSEYGPTARGVDWNSEESQITRLNQLMQVRGDESAFSIVDYGCGYGALSSYLHDSGAEFRYCGFDVSESMIETAQSLHGTCHTCTFESNPQQVGSADYVVASGVFNVKLDTSEETWLEYVIDSLAQLDRLAVKGFAFNMLTSYSDPERMRSDLYYGSPAFFFDHCVRSFSRWVALYHDYRLYEFTVVVRKVV